MPPRSDRILATLVAGGAFALGCQRLVDSDAWWHARAGRWIVENRGWPDLDPFSFASADRPWIDLHWIFQLLMAGVESIGGGRGMVLLAAGLFAGVVLVALDGRDRRWPMWVVAACWLPSIVLMSARSAPRPEWLSMLALAGYVGVLRRAEANPRWLRVLPIVQVVWVNAHGLFVLGPVVLGIYLVDRLIVGGVAAARPAFWAMAGVVLACFLNPYGWRGALLPMELAPKLTAWGALYKTYIVELMSWREFVSKQGTSLAAGNLYNRIECFLFWALPLGIVAPAIGRSRGVVIGFALALAMAGLGAVGLPARGVPRGIVELGRLAPLGMATLGVVGAVLLWRRSPRAALLAASGGLGEAAWMAWLRGYLFEPAGGMAMLGGSALAFGGLALGPAIRGGARPLRVLLAIAFGVLAVASIRNAGLFAMAAGLVLAGDLGEWASGVEWRWGRTVVAGLAILLIVGTVTGGIFRATGERRAFGLSAMPTAYAHDAARFAGRPGMPTHAIVYSLRQAGVYVHHNGPDGKVFLDGRLEVPSPRTFAEYVRLERELGSGRRGWSGRLHELGDPLILLDHEAHADAEATLLADPGWRCVYYDGVASVFVSRRSAPGFAAVDFRARHFDDRAWRGESGALAIAEGRALLAVGSTLRGRPGSRWTTWAPLLLSACDRLRAALEDHPDDAATWAMLGDALARLSPPSSEPGPEEAWDPSRALLTAQATYCYRRALEHDPGEIRALFALFRSFGARGMTEARGWIASRMRRAWASAVLGDPDAETGPDPEGLALPAGTGVEPRPAEGMPPDRAASVFMHMGRPDDAREVWRGSARLGDAAMAALDYPTARALYRSALAERPDLGPAWVGLALLHAQLGEAGALREACDRGLRCALSPDGRLLLERLGRLADAGS